MNDYCVAIVLTETRGSAKQRSVECAGRPLLRKGIALRNRAERDNKFLQRTTGYQLTQTFNLYAGLLVLVFLQLALSISLSIESLKPQAVLLQLEVVLSF